MTSIKKTNKDKSLNKVLSYTNASIFLFPKSFKNDILSATNVILEDNPLYTYHHVLERLNVDDHFNIPSAFSTMTVFELLIILYAIVTADRLEHFNGKLIRHLVKTKYISHIMIQLKKQRTFVNDEIPEDFFERIN